MPDSIEVSARAKKRRVKKRNKRRFVSRTFRRRPGRVVFDRRERGRGLVALAGAGTGQRRVRIVRAAAVGDAGGHAVRVSRRVRVLSLAVAGVVRGVAGERTGSDLAGSLRHSFKYGRDQKRLETISSGVLVNVFGSVLTNATTFEQNTFKRA